MPVSSPAAGTTVVVMGVSGAGKSTIAAELARRLGWAFAEGDDLHSPASVAKMRAGIPLDDDDRRPWLRRLAAWIGEQEREGNSAVLTCSALKRSYRDALRDGHPGVWFAHVAVSRDTLAARLAGRTGHFMPAALLDSQLATLEPLDRDEPGREIAGEDSLDATVTRLITALTAAQAGGRREPAQPSSVPVGRWASS